MTKREERQRRKRALWEAERTRRERRRKWLNALATLCLALGGVCLFAVLFLMEKDSLWALLAWWGLSALWTAAAWLIWYLDPNGTSAFLYGLRPMPPRVRRHGNFNVALVLSGITLALSLLLLSLALL